VSLNSSGLTATAASPAVPPASGVWLRRVLLAVAAFETLLGLEEFSGAFDLYDAPLSFGQFVINARLAVHPFFAIAALVLAGRRYLRIHPVKALRAGASCRLIQVPVSVGRDLESCK
jgi:hypothetical protein